MRKITEKTAGAFVDHRAFSMGNTFTNGKELYLHGNLIARWAKDNQENEVLTITLAGWNTTTTRERVNGVLDLAGIDVRVVQRDFEPCLLSLKSGDLFGISSTDHYGFPVAEYHEAQRLIEQLEMDLAGGAA